MGDEPPSFGAGADDIFVRRGKRWESARRLEAQSAAAQKAGLGQKGEAFGHGVSVTSLESNRKLSRDPDDCVTARRITLEEAGFEVRHTPTRNDLDHHTIQLPDPVTEETAETFNTVFGRTKKRT